MNIFFYLPERYLDSLRLLRALAPVVPMFASETYSDHQALGKRLRQPIEDEAVAVLLVPDLPTLKAFRAMRDLLAFVRVILVMPSDNPEMLKQAHDLRPRYLAAIEGDFQDAAAVLGRMIHRSPLPEQQEALLETEIIADQPQL